MTQATNSNILALDVGDTRVGVAIASTVARLPRPLTTLQRGDNILKELSDVIKSESVGEIVVGLPRNLAGQATSQTEATEKFVEELKNEIQIPVHWQDEAVTSKQAETELKNRGKAYEKGDIDSLAATYILEDFLNGYNKDGTKDS